MDASKITELMQKQSNRYINRAKTVDSSTLTWQNQIQSSKYIPRTPTCSTTIAAANTDCNAPTLAACSNNDGTCNFGGQGRNTTLMTGSPKQYLNSLYSSKGSGGFEYTSDNIMLQKAGKQACAVPGLSPAPENSYVTIDTCYCTNTNAPSVENPAIVNTNPYLPRFDQYYALKNKTCGPCVEGHHFVRKCNGKTVEPLPPPPPPPTTNEGWAALVYGEGIQALNTSVCGYNGSAYTTGYFRGNVDFYDGSIVQPGTYRMSLLTVDPSDSFVARYNDTGILQWVALIETVTANFNLGFSVTTDSTGVYVTGAFDNEISFFNGQIGMPSGPPVTILTGNSSGSIFIAKYDLDGVIQWVTRIDNKISLFFDIDLFKWQIYSDNTQVYLVAYCNGNLGNIDIYDTTNNVTPAMQVQIDTADFANTILATYNTNGVLQWATKIESVFGGETENYGITVTSDTTGLYIAGHFLNSINFYNGASPSNIPTPTTVSISASDFASSYLVKFDKLSGLFLWASKVDSIIVFARSITSDNNSIYASYVITENNGTCNIFNGSSTGPIDPIAIPVTISSNHKCLLVKYTTTGVIQWIMQNENGTIINIYSDDVNLYLTGYFRDSINLYNGSISGLTGTPITLTSNGDNDAFIAKYNPDGIIQWATKVGGIGNDVGLGIFSSGSEIYVAGYASDSADFYEADGSSGAAAIPTITFTAPAAHPYGYLVKYNTDGKIIY
jgi:hypothetical protein